VRTIPLSQFETLFDDCLFSVLQFLTIDDISRIRQVSTALLAVASSNAIWKPIVQSFFIGEPKFSYCGAFFYTQSTIPHLISFDKFTQLGNAIEYNPVVEQTYSDITLKTSYSYFYLPNKRVASDPKTHKLAFIMSVLNENGHIPKLSDLITVGQEEQEEKSHTVLVPLYELCYDVQKRTKFELITKYSSEVCIMPNVDSEFIPFVKVTNMQEPIEDTTPEIEN
jgi:hypothetical protein